MLTPEIIDAMVSTGCTAEQIAAVVKAYLLKAGEEELKRKEGARIRKQKSRMSRNVTVTSCDNAGQSVTKEAPPLIPPFPLPAPTPNPPYNPPQENFGEVSRKPRKQAYGISFRNWLEEIKKTDPEIDGEHCPDLLYGESERIGLSHSAIRQWSVFHDHWLAQTGQKAVKADWVAAWRNWLRRDFGNGNR